MCKFYLIFENHERNSRLENGKLLMEQMVFDEPSSPHTGLGRSNKCESARIQDKSSTDVLYDRVAAFLFS